MGTVWLSVSDGVIVGASRVNESLLPPLSNTAFPFGVFNCNISEIGTGATVNVTIDLLEDLPPEAAYWAYGRTINDTNPHWEEIPINVSEDNRTITMQFTDGGRGDEDLTANEVILTIGGLGAPMSTRPVGAPIVTTFGLVALITILSAIAVLSLKTRKKL